MAAACGIDVARVNALTLHSAPALPRRRRDDVRLQTVSLTWHAMVVDGFISW